MGTWDTPPTPQELAGAQEADVWASPPTPEELETANVSKGKSAARGAAQGATGGFGEELVAAMQTLPRWARALTPVGALMEPVQMMAEISSGVSPETRARAAAVDAEREARPDAPDLGTRYRDVRDSERRANERARAANPKAYIAGEIGGALPSAVAMGGSGTLGALVKGGAKMGAVSGLGTSRADLTQGDVGQAATDTALGAGVGAASGVVGYALPKALGAAMRPAARKGAELLERLGLRKGREVLTGKALAGQHQLANQKELSDAAVRRALDEKAIRPLSTTDATAARLSSLREEAGDALATVVRELEAAGVDGPSAHKMAAELFLRAKDVEANTVASQAPGYLRKIAEDLADKFQPGEKIPLARAEALKRSLQEAARNEYKRLGGVKELGEAKMEGAAKLRQGVEEAVESATQAAPPGSAVAQLGRAFVPAKQRAGELIQASDAADFAARRMSLTPEDSLLGSLTGVATGDPVTGLAAALGKAGLRNRGPSTAATAAYGGSKLLRSLAKSQLPPKVRQSLESLPSAAQIEWLDRWTKANADERAALAVQLQGR